MLHLLESFHKDISLKKQCSGGGVAGNVAANKLEDITACDIEGCLFLMKEKRSF
ncbi:hypothetical protein [Holdemanella sp.]|uniref:hypothetical protein n=1 Tax=Holdemanella sp. TaxID=1971762 RepID=UPI003AEFB018